MQKITGGLLKLLMSKFFRRQANTEVYLAKETDGLRHDWLLHDIIEGRMRGKPT